MMFIILLLVCFIIQVYNHFLIPAYDFHHEPVTYKTRQEYIENTIEIKEFINVYKYLKSKKLKTYKNINKFLTFIIYNPILLSKIKIVSDGSYRNIYYFVDFKFDRINFIGEYRKNDFIKKHSLIFNLFWFMLFGKEIFIMVSSCKADYMNKRTL